MGLAIDGNVVHDKRQYLSGIHTAIFYLLKNVKRKLENSYKR